MDPLVSIAHAAAASSLDAVLNPVITNIMNPLIEAAFALAVLVFAYGVMQMVINQTDTEAHTRGKWSMLGGIIGIFIMISAWGLINLVFNTVNTFK